MPFWPDPNDATVVLGLVPEAALKMPEANNEGKRQAQIRTEAMAHKKLVADGTLLPHTEAEEARWHGQHKIGAGAHGSVVLWVQVDEQDRIVKVRMLHSIVRVSMLIAVSA
jgi:hypothetical protein